MDDEEEMGFGFPAPGVKRGESFRLPEHCVGKHHAGEVALWGGHGGKPLGASSGIKRSIRTVSLWSWQR